MKATILPTKLPLKEMRNVIMALVSLVALASSSFGQTVITVNMEIGYNLWLVPDLDVTITVDADGTIEIDQSGPNILNDVHIPAEYIPDGMTPVTVDAGTVSPGDAESTAIAAVAGGLIRGYINEAIGDVVAWVKARMQAFLDWINSAASDASEWLTSLFQQAQSGGSTSAAIQIIALGQLDDSFGAALVLGIAEYFEAWIAAN